MRKTFGELRPGDIIAGAGQRHRVTARDDDGTSIRYELRDLDSGSISGLIVYPDVADFSVTTYPQEQS